jgi:hypothetical protein
MVKKVKPGKKDESKTALEAAGSKTSDDVMKFEKSKLYRNAINPIVTVADGKKASRTLELLASVARTLDDPVETERTIIIGNKDDKVYAWRIAMTVLEHGTAHAKVVQIKSHDRLLAIHKRVMAILTYARMRNGSFRDVEIRSTITSVTRHFRDGIQVEYHMIFAAIAIDALPESRRTEKDDRGKTEGK